MRDGIRVYSFLFTEMRQLLISSNLYIFQRISHEETLSSNFELLGHPNGFPIPVELEIGSDAFPNLLLRVENALRSRIVVRRKSCPSYSEIGKLL